MPVTIWISEETVGQAAIDKRQITLPAARLTVRQLIREQVLAEIARRGDARRTTIVEPHETEKLLNQNEGGNVQPNPQRGRLDPEAEVAKACRAFEGNGFFILIDGRQPAELDEMVLLHEDSQVQFIRLVPLIGG